MPKMISKLKEVVSMLDAAIELAKQKDKDAAPRTVKDLKEARSVVESVIRRNTSEEKSHDS